MTAQYYCDLCEKPVTAPTSALHITGAVDGASGPVGVRIICNLQIWSGGGFRDAEACFDCLLKHIPLRSQHPIYVGDQYPEQYPELRFAMTVRFPLEKPKPGPKKVRNRKKVR